MLISIRTVRRVSSTPRAIMEQLTRFLIICSLAVLASKKVTSVTSSTTPNGVMSTTSCPQNYFGRNCSVNCEEHTDLTNGYYTCDASGNKTCLKGYIGDECKNPDPTVSQCIRVKPCQNGGTCEDLTYPSFKCHCSSLYSGRRCDTLMTTTTSPPGTSSSAPPMTPKPSSSPSHSGALTTVGTTRHSNAAIPTSGPAASSVQPVDTRAETSSSSAVIGGAVTGAMSLLLLVIAAVLCYKFCGCCKRNSNKVSDSRRSSRSGTKVSSNSETNIEIAPKHPENLDF